jgi:hypothetical protein
MAFMFHVGQPILAAVAFLRGVKPAGKLYDIAHECVRHTGPW